MGEMLGVDGYRMFRGTMIIEFISGTKTVSGTWLYRPDTDCWYCAGCSYPSQICSVKEIE